MIQAGSHALVGTRLSVMMFLQFFVWGAWYVTVGNYMTQQGMGGSIGNAYTVGPIAAILSPFFLGLIADRFFATERVLGVVHILGGIAIMVAPLFAEGENASSTLFVGMLFVHMFFYMPTLGLTNSLALHNMSNPEKQFPMVRVFGTIGWIAANFVVSKVLKADFESTPLTVAGIAGIGLGIYCFTLPHTPPPAKGAKPSVKDVLGLDALAYMKDRAFSVFIIASLLICIPLAGYYGFAPVFVGEKGFEDPAFVMSFGQMSEIFFMLVMPLFFVRLGVKWMLAVGMLAWVVRYGLFSAGSTDDGVRWMILTGILLHGICYDFFFVTGFIYVDQVVKKELRARAQGFLVVVTQGLGLGIGAQAFQRLVDRNTVDGAKDWQAIWLAPCIMAGVIMLLFIALFNYRKPQAGEGGGSEGGDESGEYDKKPG